MSKEVPEQQVDTDNTITFQAEVQQLLNLVIHSLYSDKEVFLRELISNASDACDRLRFESLTNEAMRETDEDSAIHIEVDKKGKKIVISDNGIGMSKDEVVQNIGTIARSGTKRFVESLSGEQSEDARLIGQFGVGFYSAFMVAEKVELQTRRAGEPPQSGVRWESDGVNGYTIDDETIENCGTTITLTLRKEAKEYLELYAVRNIIKKYSDHVSIPVEIRDKPKKKETGEWETANAASALWTRAKKDISEDEYDNFYKSLTFDIENPLARTHTRVEGKMEYSALLYVPLKVSPWDSYNPDRRKGIKLYVRRVYIMDDTENLMPGYLRFVRGVIDSDDLPLNVSREFLQKNKQVERIRNGLVKKILNELKRMAQKDAEKYETFWQEFGRIFKEGLTEDTANKDTLAGLLRFASTKGDGDKQSVSLQDYVDRIAEKQDSIYYITADSYGSAIGSPHLEVFRKHDVEVLLLTDAVDEWVVMHLTEFFDKPLKSIAKGDLTLDWLDEQETVSGSEISDEKVETLVSKLKTSLEGRAEDVRVTARLTDSPACLVSTTEYELSRHMTRILKASGQNAPDAKSILEINPDHPLIQNLLDHDDSVDDWAHVLFDQATLSEGAPLEKPSDYVRRVNTLLAGSIAEQQSVIITP